LTNLPVNLPANLPAVSGTLPDMGVSLLRVGGALVLVIALFLGGVWLFKNWQRFVRPKSCAARLSVLEVKSLGYRQNIYVVGYQQERLLLASSPAGISLVSHLPAAEEEKTTVPIKMSFAEAFQQVLTRGRS
jgi:flagellar biogenesis protein FliO